MSESEPSDRSLIARIRQGDDEAVALLWRRHRLPVTKLAAVVSSHSMADDLSSEAFERTITALCRGSGPDELVRPYLYTVVRHLASREHRYRQHFVDDVELDSVVGDVTDGDPAAMMASRFSASTLGRAFRTLPERWQAVLWYVDVEGIPPRRAASAIGLKPGATSSLLYRARRSLRAAWMQAHLELERAPEECRRALAVFGAVQEGTASARDRQAFENHVTTCRRCSALVDEARAVVGLLPSLLLLVGGAAAVAAAGTSFDRAVVAQRSSSGRAVSSRRSLAIAASIVVLVGGASGAGAALTGAFDSSEVSVAANESVASGPLLSEELPHALDTPLPEEPVAPKADADGPVVVELDPPVPAPSRTTLTLPNVGVTPVAGSDVPSGSEPAPGRHSALPESTPEPTTSSAPQAPTVDDAWEPAATEAPAIEGRGTPGTRVRVWPQGRPDAAAETEVPASGQWSIKIDDLRPTDAGVAAVTIDSQGRTSTVVSSAPFAFVPLIEAPAAGAVAGTDPVALIVRGWKASPLVIRLDGRELAAGLEIPASGVLERRIGRSTMSGLVGLAPGVHELEVAYQRLDESAAEATRVTFLVMPSAE